MNMPEATDAAALAQVAAQVAVSVAQQAAHAERLTDHEGRLRLVETAVVSLSSLPTIVQDLEGRQRADEKWRYALPMTALCALFSAVAAVITAVMQVKGG
ncbi:hypothetical protein JOL79_06990 [Microbispora sp. RL4-1S]|uniref:Uncharacterized protein n=1 Tax=Microbispora oryzae TaxID=2806554 RepID=A0A941APB8_9ACTN|nr:hypothetical protein [Microbispora oryzae]MBP2703544.1 hypothetical protein [Microbispora oryzae]